MIDDKIKINSFGSRIYKITISDRYMQDGIIRSKQTIKFFEDHQEQEADKYYRDSLDKHYLVEYERINIQISQVFNDKFNS